MSDIKEIRDKETKKLGLRPRERCYIEGNKIRIIVDWGEMDDMTCKICGDNIFWELESDPDTLHYFYKCCGLEYKLWVKAFILKIKKDEE